MDSKIWFAPGKAGVSYAGKTGYAVKHDGADIVVCTATTDLPAGVIVDVNPVDNTLAVALPGAVVPVKVSGAVKRLQRGVIAADGSATAEAAAANEVAYCQFLADGVADETVNALILAPVKRA